MIYGMSVGGNFRPNRLLVRPVLVVLGSLLDPFRQQGNLFFAQRFAFALGRHAFLVSIGQGNPEENFAVFGVARNDSRISVQIAGRAFEGVKTQPGFPVFLIGTMTGHALVGDQGLDLAIEIDFTKYATSQDEKKQD